MGKPSPGKGGWVDMLGVWSSPYSIIARSPPLPPHELSDLCEVLLGTFLPHTPRFPAKIRNLAPLWKSTRCPCMTESLFFLVFFLFFRHCQEKRKHLISNLDKEKKQHLLHFFTCMCMECPPMRLKKQKRRMQILLQSNPLIYLWVGILLRWNKFR